MTNLIPLRDVAHLRLVPPLDEGWINNQLWIPVCHTELHLACLYFPLAVRFDEGKPSLGLVLGEKCLKRPAVDASGKWQGGYKPIAVRCFPFQAREIGEDPLSDILIESASDHLADREGIPIIDDSGEPSLLIREIHRLFRLLQQSQTKFSEALDLLLIGNLLVPLEDADRKSPKDDEPPLYIVDNVRFMQANKSAFAAMARHNFTGPDVLVALLSSQRLLREQYRPKLSYSTTPHAEKATLLPQQSFGIDDSNLILDDGELISLADIDVLRDKVR